MRNVISLSTIKLHDYRFSQINIKFLQKGIIFLLKLSSCSILLKKCVACDRMRWSDGEFSYQSFSLSLQHWNKVKKIWLCYSVLGTLFFFLLFLLQQKKIVQITHGRLHFFLAGNTTYCKCQKNVAIGLSAEAYKVYFWNVKQLKLYVHLLTQLHVYKKQKMLLGSVIL